MRKILNQLSRMEQNKQESRMRSDKDEVIYGMSLCREIEKVSRDEQMKYIKSILFPIGLDLNIIFEYSMKDYKNKDASLLLQGIECFFYTMNDFVNYFIVNYTQPDMEIVMKKIVSDGSSDGNYFSLHYINHKTCPNIVPFDFSTLGSSGLLNIAEFSRERSWDKTKIILFGKEYDDKNDNLDAYMFRAVKSFVPEWIEMMKKIGKLS